MSKSSPETIRTDEPARGWAIAPVPTQGFVAAEPTFHTIAGQEAAAEMGCIVLRRTASVGSPKAVPRFAPLTRNFSDGRASDVRRPPPTPLLVRQNAEIEWSTSQFFKGVRRSSSVGSLRSLSIGGADDNLGSPMSSSSKRHRRCWQCLDDTSDYDSDGTSDDDVDCDDIGSDDDDGDDAFGSDLTMPTAPKRRRSASGIAIIP